MRKGNMQPSGKSWQDPMNKTPIPGGSSSKDGTAFPKASTIIALTNNEETKDNKKKVHVGLGGNVLGKKDVGMMVSVKPVLEAFKSNTKEGKDVKKQFARMKDLENGDEENIVTALD